MTHDYVIFDLETTGLSSERDEMIQIAAVKISGGAIQSADTFFSYINPGCFISSFISSYTGITNRDVQHAPPPAEVLRQFSQYAGDATLIAHNGHRFDMNFLKHCCLKNRLPTRSIPYHDSINFSKLVWGKRPEGHGLDAVLYRLGISAHGAQRHDARGDVALLAQAVEKMWNLLRARAQPPTLPLHQGILPALA